MSARIRDRRKLCQASAMVAVVFDSWEDARPPCDEPSEIRVRVKGGVDWLLCKGCAVALCELVGLGALAKRDLAVDRRRAQIMVVLFVLSCLIQVLAVSWWRFR